MKRYGVFKRLPNGSTLWVCPSNDLTEAKTKMVESAIKTRHEHFIHDFTLGRTVANSREELMDVGHRTKET
jgi:hypothetical protein